MSRPELVHQPRQARRVIEAWRVDYNITRPHTSLRMATPAAFAAARPFAKRQRAPAPELCGNSPPEPVPRSPRRCYPAVTDFPNAWPYVGGRVDPKRSNGFVE